MNVSDAIKVRRSIRKYSDRQVEDEKLTAVLEAARLAPSGNNRQDRKFIVVRDKNKRDALVDACGGQTFVGEAPVVIVTCALKQHLMTCGMPAETIDASIAMSFMLLEAREQGLGTCWLGYYYEDKVKQVLDIPEDVRVVSITPLGYPAENPPARPRKTISEVVSYDRF